MKIQWKPVLIAGISAELALLAIYILAKKYAGPAFVVIAILDVAGSMFLAGFWVARKTTSQFLAHGVMAGIVANAVYAVLSPLAGGWGRFFVVVVIKTLICAAGAYAGGKLSRRQAASGPPL